MKTESRHARQVPRSADKHHPSAWRRRPHPTVRLRNDIGCDRAAIHKRRCRRLAGGTLHGRLAAASATRESSDSASAAGDIRRVGIATTRGQGRRPGPVTSGPGAARSPVGHRQVGDGIRSVGSSRGDGRDQCLGVFDAGAETPMTEPEIVRRTLPEQRLAAGASLVAAAVLAPGAITVHESLAIMAPERRISAESGRFARHSRSWFARLPIGYRDIGVIQAIRASSSLA